MSDLEDEEVLGKLYLKPTNAFLTRDVDTFSAMDSYVLIRYGNLKYKTNPCEDSGKSPTWQEDFEILPKSMSDELHVFVMDKNTIGEDQNIGGCHIKLHQLCMEGKQKQQFSLLFENKKAGDINIEAIWEPKGGVTHTVAEHTTGTVAASATTATLAIGRSDSSKYSVTGSKHESVSSFGIVECWLSLKAWLALLEELVRPSAALEQLRQVRPFVIWVGPA